MVAKTEYIMKTILRLQKDLNISVKTDYIS